MNKKIIIGIIGATAFIVGLIVWGYGRTPGLSEAGSGRPSELEALEALYDFGTISMARGKVSHVFEVKNPTAEDIELAQLLTSCMCTEAYWVRPDGSNVGPFGMAGMGYLPPLNQALPAGGTGRINVVYDPAAHGPAGIGNIDRFVYLNDARGGTLAFEIKATVTP